MANILGRCRKAACLAVLLGIVLTAPAAADIMKISGNVYKTYANRSATPGVGFNVRFCPSPPTVGACTVTAVTNSTGAYSIQEARQPGYYKMFAWKDSETWGSSTDSPYLFYLGDGPIGNLLGISYFAPRPLPPALNAPANGTTLLVSPCQTTLTWTDKNDAQRKSPNWPSSYDVWVNRVGWGTFTYSGVTATSLQLQSLVSGATYNWSVTARLNVAPGVFFTTPSTIFTFSTSPNCQAIPVDAAKFVSQAPIPVNAAAGSRYNVSVSMLNTGTTVWTEAQQYRLGSQNPQDNGTWGTGRVMLPATQSVASNQTAVFHFSVQAPWTPGTYHYQWRMVHEGVRWFGDLTPDIVVTVGQPTTKPSAPTGLSPDDVTLPNTTTSVTLSWAPTAGATKYNLRVQDLSDGTARAPGSNCPTTSTYLCVNDLSATAVTLPVLPGHSYKWCVQAGNVVGFGAFTYATFSVAPAPPPPPTGLTPNGTTLPSTTTSVTLSWTATPGATKYAVRLRDDTDGSLHGTWNCPVAQTFYLCVNDITPHSYTVHVSAGHFYTWWVHAGNSAGYSSPTYASFSVAAAPAPPASPTGLTPDGATLSSSTTTVTLSWTATPGATRYAVRLRDDTDGSLRLIWSCPGTATLYVCVNDITPHSYTAPVMSGHSYTWWVHAGNDIGYSTPTYASFDVAAPGPPPSPTGLSPDGATLPSSTTSVTLSWSSTPGATRYAVRLRDDTDGSLRLIWSCPGTATLYVCVNDITPHSYTAPVMSGHSYTWWVHAGNTIGYSAPTYASFDVVPAAPPAPPTGLNPDGTMLAPGSTSVTLSWAATPGATRYAVRLRDDTDGSLRLVWSCPGTATIYVCVNDMTARSYTAPVIPGHNYTWWVHAGNDLGYSPPTYASFGAP